MSDENLIENLKPQDQIIQYIRKALQTGELAPGMRLPAERKMAEDFGVGRTHVREALKTLETYGIIKTLPQSGSVIVGLDIAALDGLLSDVLKLDSFDFAALAEMRVVLEVNAVRLCAERRTEEDLKTIYNALMAYQDAYERQNSEDIYTTDFKYHRCIAAGAQNSVLRSMLMLITPDIMTIYRHQRVCSVDNHDPYLEHKLLYQYIEEHKSNEAAELMMKHLNGVLVYAQSLRKNE